MAEKLGSKDMRQEARKKALETDSKLGVQNRVFQLRIIRPYNNESTEMEFQKLKQEYNEQIKKLKEKSKKGEISNDSMKKTVSRIEKQRKKAVKDFFDSKAKENPDTFTLPQIFEGFRLFSRVTRDVYNTAITESYIQLKKMKETGVKPDHYGNVNKAFDEISENKDAPYYGKLPEKIPSDLKQGITKKIQSNFRGRELLCGDRSLSIAKIGFSIPFYLSQGGQTEKESLVKFHKVGEDDYIAEFNTPVVIGNKISIQKIKFLCSTRKRKRNFKRNKDDATNKLIMDFISGEIVDIVKKRLCILSVKHGFTDDKKSELLRKYSQISTYEILQKPTRFGGYEWFLSVTCKNVPESVENSTNQNMIAGIDYCYSKNKIMKISIIDVDKYDKDPQNVNSWQIDTLTINDDVYGLRKIYDDYYSERRKIQAIISNKIQSNEYEYKFNLRFRNRRNYIIRVIVKKIYEFLKKKHISYVFFENLDNLSKKEDWFTVNKIRNFPRKELVNLLALKITGNQIDNEAKKVSGNGTTIEYVNPKDTSKKCSLCGKTNNSFDFKFRSERGFPPFTCIDNQCKFGGTIGNKFEEFIRDADLNAARNVALRGAGKL